MHRLEEALGPWVIRHRWLIIVATLLWVAAAASGARSLSFTTSYRVFFSADNPQLVAFEKLERTYTKNDNVLFVVRSRKGDVFDAETLTAIDELTREAWQLPYSLRVDSITNFQHTWAEEDDLVVEDLVSDPASLDAASLERIRRIALSEPLLVKRLVSEDGRTTGVNVTIQLPGADAVHETPEVVSAARRLAERIRQAHPGVEIRLTGIVPLNNAFTEASQSDIQTLLPLAFGVMLLLLAALLRSVTATLATLLVILFSIVTAMGMGGHIGYPITPPTASAPTMILTMAIASSVHILVTFLHRMGLGEERATALAESLRVNLQPVFLASATTALGFLSMNFSEVPPFRHLGNLVAIGVIASFVLSVTFLPALLSLLPVKGRRREREHDPLMVRFADGVIRNQRPLLWGFLATVLLLTSFIPRNELNDVFIHYFDETLAFRQDVDFTERHLTGLYNIEYSVESGRPGGIADPEFLRQLDAFAEWYRRQPETIHVNVITDIFKRLNRNLHGDDPAWHRLPAERNLAAQYLLLYEMSLPYGLDLNNQINVDKSATRMVVTLRTISTNDFLALERRAATWLENHAPALARAEASGPNMMFAHIGKRNILAMLEGTTLALVGISMLLILAFRSLRIGLLSLVPNLVPAAMGFGIWGLMVGEVGLALSVVTGMTLGIVVDDTVHFLSKYLRARRELGMGAEEAVRYAFDTVGRALAITSLVLAAGFLILATSHFHLNAGMGLLTAMVILLALAADFLFLPALLLALDRRRAAQPLENRT